MSHIESVRKTYHITDAVFRQVQDLMDEVRTALKAGQDYNQYKFEHKMREIVVAPEGDPAYDHHMAIEIAEAFLWDGKWEEVFLTLYKNDASQKAAIERYYEEKCGDPHK